jgi:hypothetical protein
MENNADGYLFDGEHTQRFFYKSTDNDKFLRKYPKKNRRYIRRVLAYLEMEYGVHAKLLSPGAFNLTDGVDWGGRNVPESARLIMEKLWELGYPRSEYE